MAIYNISGQNLNSAYDLNDTSLNNAYDLDGNLIFSKGTPIPDDPYIDGRVLLFEDSFNENTLNSANWSYEIGNVRNNEGQFYRSQNVSVEDGKLIITAKRETHLNKRWTSGSITGQLKKSWLYGRFEAKIKFPNLVGAFGAFWTLGANHWIEYKSDDDSTTANSNPVGSVSWPACGEIDITETIPGNATSAQANLWKYGGDSFGTGRSTAMLSSEWHIYAMEWTSEYISVLLDGVEYKRYTFSDYSSTDIQAYLLPQYIILNLAVGAAGGTPADSTNEMKMYVDWVRVYAPLT
jgi:beta-glucanase (GH16 family)